MNGKFNVKTEELLAALAYEYAIPGHRMVAFASRLRHLHRLGFLCSSRVGRGKVQTYSVQDIQLVAVAFYLQSQGMRPEIVVGAADTVLCEHLRHKSDCITVTLSGFDEIPKAVVEVGSHCGLVVNVAKIIERLLEAISVTRAHRGDSAKAQGMRAAGQREAVPG
ncbi:hypothetical protein [Novosphingobium soli]|uniref:MerR family transcriptional regulator n=1 Tax=Novosphingobium soli TaxID=574956 RepID=A0ABV6CVI5_9SPHN